MTRMKQWAGVGIGIAAACMLPTAGRAEQTSPEAGVNQAIQNGSTVQIDYTLTVDGAVVDSSEGREPLKYVQGQGQIIPGLERQLVGLHVGDTGDFTVSPEEGYGAVKPDAFLQVKRDQLPKDVTPEVGMTLRGKGPDGNPFRARIQKVSKDDVTLDLNHPLAGKTLQFKVKVVGISS